MPFAVRILLMVIVFALSSGLGFAGGGQSSQPSRMPMGAMGVAWGTFRLIEHTLSPSHRDADDDDGGGSSLDADDADMDEGDFATETASMDASEVEQHEVENHVDPEVELILDWFSERPVDAVRTRDFRGLLIPSLETLEARRFTFFMQRCDDYILRTLFCLFSFGSEVQRAEVLQVLPVLLQTSSSEDESLWSMRRLFIELLMDKLFSENGGDRDRAQQFVFALFENAIFSIDALLEAITSHLHYSATVRWDRSPAVWHDFGRMLIELARSDASLVEPIVHAIIKEVYFHLNYDGDKNLKQAIEDCLVNLANLDSEFRRSVMLALFALFIDEAPEARELNPRIPSGTLQWYQVEPIFEILKRIAGSGDTSPERIEQVVLFATLLDNERLRHALNDCLIAWVREGGMPPAVRYDAAMWLVHNTRRTFEYGPQSDVLEILLRWAESGDAGWLSLEQRMRVCAVAFVQGASVHQSRATALICGLENSGDICTVVMDIISQLCAKEASEIPTYLGLDLASLMELLIEKDPGIMSTLMERSITRLLATEDASSIGESTSPLVALIHSITETTLKTENRALLHQCFVQMMRVDGVSAIFIDAWVDAVRFVLQSLGPLPDATIEWVSSMVNTVSLDQEVDHDKMKDFLDALESSYNQEAQGLYASILELQQFLQNFMKGEAFSVRHLLYAIICIGIPDEDASRFIGNIEAITSAYSSIHQGACD